MISDACSVRSRNLVQRVLDLSCVCASRRAVGSRFVALEPARRAFGLGRCWREISFTSRTA